MRQEGHEVTESIRCRVQKGKRWFPGQDSHSRHDALRAPPPVEITGNVRRSGPRDSQLPRLPYGKPRDRPRPGREPGDLSQRVRRQQRRGLRVEEAKAVVHAATAKALSTTSVPDIPTLAWLAAIDDSTRLDEFRGQNRTKAPGDPSPTRTTRTSTTATSRSGCPATTWSRCGTRRRSGQGVRASGGEDQHDPRGRRPTDDRAEAEDRRVAVPRARADVAGDEQSQLGSAQPSGPSPHRRRRQRDEPRWRGRARVEQEASMIVHAKGTEQHSTRPSS